MATPEPADVLQVAREAARLYNAGEGMSDVYALADNMQGQQQPAAAVMPLLLVAQELLSLCDSSPQTVEAVVPFLSRACKLGAEVPFRHWGGSFEGVALQWVRRLRHPQSGVSFRTSAPAVGKKKHSVAEDMAAILECVCRNTRRPWALATQLLQFVKATDSQGASDPSSSSAEGAAESGGESKPAPSSGRCLTVFHVIALKTAIEAKMYDHALAVVTVVRTRCTHNRRDTLLDVLSYFYYAGVVFVAFKRWTEALRCFNLCIRMRVGSYPSTIQADALRKAMLVQFLEDGTLYSHNTSNVPLHRQQESPELRVAQSCAAQPGGGEDLSKQLAADQEQLRRERNYGLALQCLERVREWRLWNEAVVVAKLSLPSFMALTETRDGGQLRDLLLCSLNPPQQSRLSVRVDEEASVVAMRRTDPRAVSPSPDSTGAAVVAEGRLNEECETRLQTLYALVKDSREIAKEMAAGKRGGVRLAAEAGHDCEEEEEEEEGGGLDDFGGDPRFGMLAEGMS
eukprot:GHVU01122506.1.p1 GENE.GHVU01122506.1~~GHVU01122506.1.p1  ORF type:complete len:513 (-),score=124.72 GHVU01122506.1:148-1686(-)